ncbi:MAG: hypothetical protein ACKO2G_13285 [Verrucomicrobiales bacterium]
MRVLITNHRPDLRGRTETFVRDLAIAAEAPRATDFSVPKTVALGDLKVQLHRFLQGMEKAP